MNDNSNEALDLISTITLGITQSLSNTHTNLVAKVVKVNTTTIDVQPVVAREVNGKTIPLPVFTEVPVVNFLGGSSSIQMPIAIGDYCQLFVNERCLDSWYFGNDNQKPLSSRMFDYSDSVAFIGLKNKAGELEIPTVITMLGDTYQEGDYVHLGNRTQTGDYDLTGDMTQLGNKNQTGNFGLIGNMTITGTGGGSGTANMSNITLNMSNGNINITSGSITISGGSVTVTGGDVIADGISLKNLNTEVFKLGGSNTGVPN